MTAWTANQSQRTLKRRLARSTDPADWLVLADLLADEGDDDASRLWRRRGEWWPELHAVLNVALVARRNRTFGAAAGPFFVRFRRCPASVRVELFWDSPHPAGRERGSVWDERGVGYGWSKLWFVSEDGTATGRLTEKLDRNLMNMIAYMVAQEGKR